MAPLPPLWKPPLPAPLQKDAEAGDAGDPNVENPESFRQVRISQRTCIIAPLSVLITLVFIVAALWQVYRRLHRNAAHGGSMRMRAMLLTGACCLLLADAVNNARVADYLVRTCANRVADGIPVVLPHGTTTSLPDLLSYYAVRTVTFLPVPIVLMLAVLHRTVGLLLAIHNPRLSSRVLVIAYMMATCVLIATVTAIVSEIVRVRVYSKEKGLPPEYFVNFDPMDTLRTDDHTSYCESEVEISTHFRLPPYGIAVLFPQPFVVVVASLWSLRYAYSHASSPPAGLRKPQNQDQVERLCKVRFPWIGQPRSSAPAPLKHNRELEEGLISALSRAAKPPSFAANEPPCFGQDSAPNDAGIPDHYRPCNLVRRISSESRTRGLCIINDACNKTTGLPQSFPEMNEQQQSRTIIQSCSPIICSSPHSAHQESLMQGATSMTFSWRRRPARSQTQRWRRSRLAAASWLPSSLTDDNRSLRGRSKAVAFLPIRGRLPGIAAVGGGPVIEDGVKLPLQSSLRSTFQLLNLAAIIIWGALIGVYVTPACVLHPRSRSLMSSAIVATGVLLEAAFERLFLWQCMRRHGNLPRRDCPPLQDDGVCLAPHPADQTGAQEYPAIIIPAYARISQSGPLQYISRCRRTIFSGRTRSRVWNQWDPDLLLSDRIPLSLACNIEVLSLPESSSC